MRILWITNIILPPLCEYLGFPSPVVGGWMYSSIKRLRNCCKNMVLGVATVYSGKDFKKVEIDGIIYYLLPLYGGNMQVYHKHLELIWQQIARDFFPDLVHLHGTEFPHGLAFLRMNLNVKTVVSIQGLVSVCQRYYLKGLGFKDIIGNITFRDVIRLDNLWQQRNDFKRRGIYEREIINRSNCIIGRTTWDEAHCRSISPHSKYYFCNETLRDEFYSYRWAYNTCEKHSLFLSQANYPIKGLHIVLKALPLVKREFSDVKLYIAGYDIRRTGAIGNRIRRGGYGKYILRLIKKMGLESNVIFTGPLTEKQMCRQYLRTNIFICPSSIENSPNSLGEAQLMGVPCIASYVGGIPDIMKGYERGEMYPFEEYEMLAMLINGVFKKCFDEEMQYNPAIDRHDPEVNVLRLLAIYSEIIGCKL